MLTELKQIDDYRILDVLGAGGFGITYLARDETLEVEVAIKEFMPGHLARREGTTVMPLTDHLSDDYDRQLESFINEARAVARLQHDSVVRVRRCFKANGTAYMVMDYENGQDFGAWLGSLGRPPTERELKRFLVPFLDGLEAVHEKGLVHRDIKPSNIIVRHKDQSPVLIDFGAARRTDAAHFTAILTAGYAPYEQYEESAAQGPWTDIYGVAAVLYRAATGIKPLAAPYRMARESLVPAVNAAIDHYSRPFLQAIDRGLALMPAARPQSVAAWRTALIPPETTAPAPAPPPPVETPAGRDPADETLSEATRSIVASLPPSDRSAGEPAAADHPAPPSAPPVAADLEAEAWGLASTADSLAGYRTYLQAHPNGAHADRARAKVAELEAADRERRAAAAAAAAARAATPPPAAPTTGAARPSAPAYAVAIDDEPDEYDAVRPGDLVVPQPVTLAVLGFLGLIVMILGTIVIRSVIGPGIGGFAGATVLTFGAATAYALFSGEVNTVSALAAGAATAVGCAFALLLMMMFMF